MLGLRRRRSAPSATFGRAPVVGELFAAAQVEAIAFRHDSIGTEHMLLALLELDDGSLAALGLDKPTAERQILGVLSSMS